MDYLKLMRIKHYIKNLLIFIPLFFSKNILDTYKLSAGLIGFMSFCLISSTIYIFNDICDVEKDRIHLKKKNRPIASGKISRTHALVLMGGLLIIFLSISLAFLPKQSIAF